MSVEANTSDDGNTLIVKISGKFDISLSKTFGDSYENKIHSVSKVVLDMADVQHIDSSGLGMMLMLRERFGEDKEKIEIVKTVGKKLAINKRAQLEKLEVLQVKLGEELKIQKSLIMNKEQMIKIVVSESLDILKKWQKDLIKEEWKKISTQIK